MIKNNINYLYSTLNIEYRAVIFCVQLNLLGGAKFMTNQLYSYSYHAFYRSVAVSTSYQTH